MNGIKLFFVLLILVFVSCSKKDNSSMQGSSSSNANETVYDAVTIGTQVWMKNNLDIAAEGSKCYDDDNENCKKYGRLYDWKTAMAACPKGWHLPSNAEWDVLYKYVDSSYSSKDGYSRVAGKYLKARNGWYDYDGEASGNGEDTYGFAALPGGDGSLDGVFFSAGNSGNWWSATESDEYNAYLRGMRYHGDNAQYGSGNKAYLFSIRCLRD